MRSQSTFLRSVTDMDSISASESNHRITDANFEPEALFVFLDGFITRLNCKNHNAKTFDRTRTGVSALSVGAARTAYEVSREWAKNRIQFGKPIASQQAVGFMLADMATDVEVARLITHKAAWAYDTQQKGFSML